MSNPLFDSLGGGMPGNMAGLMNQFNQFKNTFTGDPRAQVQQMLNSGQISQSQFNQVTQMATQLRNMMR